MAGGVLEQSIILLRAAVSGVDVIGLNAAVRQWLDSDTGCL